MNSDLFEVNHVKTHHPDVRQTVFKEVELAFLRYENVRLVLRNELVSSIGDEVAGLVDYQFVYFILAKLKALRKEFFEVKEFDGLEKI